MVAGVEVWRSRFDVNKDVCDGGEAGAYGVFHGVRDGVSLPHGEVGVDDDVEVCVEVESHFTDPAGFDGDDVLDGLGGLGDGVVDGGVRGGVHHAGDCVAEEIDSVVSDEDTGEEGGVIVCGFEAWSSDDCDGDADEGGEGGERVGAVVPCVGVDCGASDLEGEFEDAPEEDFFDEDDAGEDEQGEGGWCVVRGDDFADTACGEKDCGDNEGEGDGEGGEGFGFAVSVGVFVVGRLCGEGESESDHGGAEEI